MNESGGTALGSPVVFALAAAAFALAGALGAPSCGAERRIVLTVETVVEDHAIDLLEVTVFGEDGDSETTSFGAESGAWTFPSELPPVLVRAGRGEMVSLSVNGLEGGRIVAAGGTTVTFGGLREEETVRLGRVAAGNDDDQPPDGGGAGDDDPPCTGVCLPEPCGDGVVGGDEECDDGNAEDGDGCTHWCQEEPPGCADSTCSEGEDCLNCPTDCGGCTEPGNCGNGYAEGDEECDRGDLRHQACSSIGYAPGILGCTSLCTFDVSLCGPPADG